MSLGATLIRRFQNALFAATSLGIALSTSYAGAATPRDQELAHAYEVGRRAGYAATILVGAFIVVVVALVRWESRRREAERREALAGESFGRAHVPFPMLLGAVIVGFVGIGAIGFLTVKQALVPHPTELHAAGDGASALDGVGARSKDEVRKALASLRLQLDSSGISLNGKPIAGAEALPIDKLARIESVVAAIHTFDNYRDAYGLHDPVPTYVTIAPDVPAVRAGALLATVGKLGGRVSVAVGDTRFDLNYLPSSPIPVESFFYVSPHASAGYSIERQRVSRDFRTKDAPCRERSARRDLSSEREVKAAAGELCAKIVDCVDHVEMALSPGRSFGEAAPWMAAAIGLVRFPDLRLLVEGAEPFPDAVTCADAGAHGPPEKKEPR